MSWVKIDDRIFDNPKIAGLTDGALVAYLRALCYCARELTDGFVPGALGLDFARRRPRALELVEAGLWHGTEKGFEVHDYLKYNPTREQVLAERAAAQARMFARRSGDVRANKQVNIGRSSATPVPDPDPQPELPEPEPEPERGPRGRGRPLSAVDQDVLDDRQTKHPTLDVRREFERFKIDLDANGKTWKNYIAAFDKWLMNGEDYAKRGLQNARQPSRNGARGDAGRNNLTAGDIAEWEAYKRGDIAH